MIIENLEICNCSGWLKISFNFRDYDLASWRDVVNTCHSYHDNILNCLFSIGSYSAISKIWIKPQVIKDVHEINLKNMYNKTFLLMISDDDCFRRKFLSELLLKYLDFNERVFDEI